MKFPPQHLSVAVGLGSLLLAETSQAAPPPPSHVVSRSTTHQKRARPSNRGFFTWLDDTNTPKSPALYHDFPDPTIIQADDGWYAFGTASGDTHVQVAKADDPSGPWEYQDMDLLADPGAWTDGSDIWAPDIRQVDNGSYVMYYTAQLGNSSRHCLGVATSDSILGTYQVSDEPWQCDYDLGGSIDSSGFRDDDGTRWVVYKIDGNTLGSGGSCDNTVDPIQPTPLMLQQVDVDGITKIGSPVEILDRTDVDGPLVEAPNIIKSSGGKYILFYSSHCFTSTGYNVLYATATDVQGPYTRHDDALLETGDFNLTSPGGGTSVVQGGLMVFHGDCDAGGSDRCMFVSNFTETGTNVLANR